MSKINNLTQGNFGEILKRLRRLEMASPLGHSSIGRGRMRFYDQSELLIENGALNVTGTATISGTLKASGTIDFTGTLTQSGPSNFTGKLTIAGDTSVTGDFNVTGPTKLDGPTSVGGTLNVTGKTTLGGDTTVSGKLGVSGPMSTTGTLSVEGVTTLKNNLNVTSGGKIKAGNLEIEPANGGQINMTGGAISSGTFGLLINNNTAVTIGSTTIKLDTLPTKTGASANVHIDSAGRLWKVG